MSEHVTTREAASLANVTTTTIRMWAKKGYIKVVKVEGKRGLIEKASLETHMTELGDPIGSEDDVDQQAKTAHLFVQGALRLRQRGRKAEERSMLWLAIQEMGLVTDDELNANQGSVGQ